jgi:hypothetical protein
LCRAASREGQDDIRGEVAEDQAIDRTLVPVGGEPQDAP